MSNGLEPSHSGNGKWHTIQDELARLKQLKFKFSCLGIGCLGWTVIVLLILVYYLFLR